MNELMTTVQCNALFMNKYNTIQYEWIQYNTIQRILCEWMNEWMNEYNTIQ